MQLFGQKMITTRNIVQQEKSQLSKRKLSEIEEKDDGDLQIYDEDVNDVIKKLVKSQGNCKYYLT